MDLKSILSNIIGNKSPALVAGDSLPAQLTIELQDLIDQSLEDEDADENGWISRFVPRAFLNIGEKNSSREFLKEMLATEFQNTILDRFQVELKDGATARLNLESLNPQSESPPQTGMNGFKDTVTVLCITGGTGTLILGNDEIKFSDGCVFSFSNQFGIFYQLKSNEHKLRIATLTVRTRLVDVNIIHHQSKCKVGVIVDCKNMESPSQVKDLEYSLANITRANLVAHGFSNIVMFSSRDDFDRAVENLKEIGVEKILTLFAGATVGKDTFSKLETAPHITAWKEDSRVYRKYVIFEPNKYTGFQIKGEYLSNVVDLIHSQHSADYGIAYLQPDDFTYLFLEEIVNNRIPSIELLSSDDVSHADVEEGEMIIERMKEIMLNTVREI